MSGFEIAVYLSIYAAVVLIGLTIAAKSRKPAEPSADYDLPFANENYEKPLFGSGVGNNRPSASYVKLSNQRKAG